MYIKFIDAENQSRTLRFFVNHSGVQWYVKRKLDDVVELAKGLAKSYHTAEFFKSNLFRRFLKVQEEQSFNHSLNDMMSQVMMELTSLYVIRKD